MITKQLYYSQYNYQNEIHKMWTRAGSPAAAHRNFIAKLTKLLGISGYKLRCYFNGHKDNFKIKEINNEKINLINRKFI